MWIAWAVSASILLGIITPSFSTEKASFCLEKSMSFLIIVLGIGPNGKGAAGSENARLPEVRQETDLI